jgi:hypothetical protein
MGCQKMAMNPRRRIRPTIITICIVEGPEPDVVVLNTEPDNRLLFFATLPTFTFFAGDIILNNPTLGVGEPRVFI